MEELGAGDTAADIRWVCVSRLLSLVLQFASAQKPMPRCARAAQPAHCACAASFLFFGLPGVKACGLPMFFASKGPTHSTRPLSRCAPSRSRPISASGPCLPCSPHPQVSWQSCVAVLPSGMCVSGTPLHPNPNRLIDAGVWCQALSCACVCTGPAATSSAKQGSKNLWLCQIKVSAPVFGLLRANHHTQGHRYL